MAQWKDAARPEYRPFAESLRAAMGKRGMSASDVAREIWGSTTDRRGYSVAKNRDRIGLYLAATSYPDDENMKELARVLEIPFEELAGKLAQADSGNTPQGNPGPRPSRSSGPSLTPVPGRTGLVRIQVDQVVDWRLAMRVFSELSQAAELEAEVEGKDVANAVAKVQARARAHAAEIKEQAEKAEGHGGRGSDNEVA